MEARLKELEHLIAADPKNINAQAELITIKARLGDYESLRKPLRDRKVWQRTPEIIQDLSINYVLEKLDSERWQYKETKTFSCVNKRRKEVIEEDKNSNSRKNLFNIKIEAVEEEISHRIALFIHKKTGIVFCLIPGGFLVKKEENFFRDFPPFLIAQAPIAQAQFLRGFPEPVDSDCFLPPDVTWEHAKEWCELNALRLPNNYEWEYAGRAGTKTDYYWGDAKETNHQFCFELRSIEDSINSQLWNSFGLTDLFGNALEWTDSGHVVGGPGLVNPDYFLKLNKTFRPVATFDLEN